MSARGALAKEKITEKILNTFSGSFLYNNGKEIRIPWVENSETLQIKVSLTCAKVNVESGSENAVPGQVGNTPSISVMNEPTSMTKPSAEEKRRVEKLVRELGL